MLRLSRLLGYGKKIWGNLYITCLVVGMAQVPTVSCDLFYFFIPELRLIIGHDGFVIFVVGTWLCCLGELE